MSLSVPAHFDLPRVIVIGGQSSESSRVFFPSQSSKLTCNTGGKSSLIEAVSGRSRCHPVPSRGFMV